MSNNVELTPRQEQRRNEILAAARETFGENGYEQTSMAALAMKLGIAEATLYKYFDSKWDVLLAVLEQWYDRMFGDYSRDLSGVSDATSRLRLLIWRHLRTLRDHSGLCRLMFQQARANPNYKGSRPQALNRRYTELLVEVLIEGSASGEFRQDLPTTLLRDMIYGGIEHHAWQYLNAGGELDIDVIADQITNLICTGIAGDEHPSNVNRETGRLAKIVTRMEKTLGSTGRFSTQPKTESSLSPLGRGIG